jgi:hypothetical protein
MLDRVMKSRGIGEGTGERRENTRGRDLELSYTNLVVDLGPLYIPFTRHSGPSTFLLIDRAPTVSACLLVLVLAQLSKRIGEAPRRTRLYTHTARGFIFGE